jgi:predicted dehydrogenase
LTDRFEDLLTDRSLDAVAVVTPIPTHRSLAEAALRAGKHVFVEKPLAQTADDAARLVDLADRQRLVLATGHVFVYHPAVNRLREAVTVGELGRLYYVDAARVNLGPPNPPTNVVWDLGVHDVAILLSLLSETPTEVSAQGYRYAHHDTIDVVFARLAFDSGLMAQLHASWLSAMKVRRFFVSGSEGSAIFDDTLAKGKLSLAGPGEDNRTGSAVGETAQLAYKSGEIRTPDLGTTLPLTVECEDFLRCVRAGAQPRSSGRDGWAVVRVLEAIERSIAAGGRTVRLAEV